MCFTSDDESQNMFVYQPTLDALELKRTKILVMLLIGNQRGYELLNLRHCVLLSCITQNVLDIE